MTRRQLFRRRPLSLQAYIHRATVGLPRAERLDAAAELRTHLVERIDILRAEGHPADEAEFLAVQAMGDPAPTNRGLLGHAFTHRLGWLALGLVLIGGGGWYGYGYAQREWMPPREGILLTGEALTLDDLRALNTDSNAPKSIYQSATLTYPKGTKTIYYLLVTPGRANLQQKDLAKEFTENLRMNKLSSFPGSYRYQERWLMTEMKSNSVCPGRWELYFSTRLLRSRFMPLHSFTGLGLSDLPWDHSTAESSCTGVRRQFRSVTRTASESELNKLSSKKLALQSKEQWELLPQGPGSTYSSDVPKPLPLNHWTILRQLVLNPRTAANGSPTAKGTSSGMYIAVLPSNEPAGEEGTWGNGTDVHGNVSHLHYDGKSLPQPPQLNAELTQFEVQ